MQHLSVGTQRFAALYLPPYGIVMLWLIIALLRHRLWYYPTSIGIFWRVHRLPALPLLIFPCWFTASHHDARRCNHRPDIA
nr:hypothetical protein [Burkholderia cepacia]